MTKNYRLLTLLLLPVLLLLQQGCVVVTSGDGAGSYTQFNGQYKKDINKNLQTVYDSSLSTIADLGLTKINSNIDGMTAQVTARNIKDEKIKIVLTKRSSTVTQITIRVGMIGDIAASQFLMDEIEKRLL